MTELKGYEPLEKIELINKLKEDYFFHCLKGRLNKDSLLEVLNSLDNMLVSIN